MLRPPLVPRFFSYMVRLLAVGNRESFPLWDSFPLSYLRIVPVGTVLLQSMASATGGASSLRPSSMRPKEWRPEVQFMRLLVLGLKSGQGVPHKIDPVAASRCSLKLLLAGSCPVASRCFVASSAVSRLMASANEICSHILHVSSARNCLRRTCQVQVLYQTFALGWANSKQSCHICNMDHKLTPRAVGKTYNNKNNNNNVP